MNQIGVIGGGPIGLLSALALTNQRRGMPYVQGENLTIFDQGDPQKTAGNSASAFVDSDWSTTSGTIRRRQTYGLGFYSRLAGNPQAGVEWGPLQVLRRKARALEFGERPMTAEELYPGYSHGTVAQTYRINPPKFLAWARDKLSGRGVRFVTRKVLNFEELRGEGMPLVVNAAGMGARELTGDNTLIPYRGHCASIRWTNAWQVVRLAALEQAWYVATGPDECRIGSTSDPECWDLNPDPVAVDAMYRRVQTFMPSGFDPWAGQISVSCGLRPRRKDGVRLEVEDLPSGLTVIHCYGHGGDGFRDGPGTAAEVWEHAVPHLVR